MVLKGSENIIHKQHLYTCSGAGEGERGGGRGGGILIAPTVSCSN